METLIKFRLLASELQPKECQLFLFHLVDVCGVDLIFSSIFDHFCEAILNSKPYDVNQLNTMNSIISIIMNSRTQDNDRQKDESPSSKIMKLDEITAPLLSNIASYLKKREYFALQQVNRKVYIGCNSPFSLTKLDLFYQRGGQTALNCNKYSSIKHLSIFTSKFNASITPYSNYHSFNNLRELELFYADKEDIDIFLKQDCIDLDGITYLSIQRFGESNGWYLDTPLTNTSFFKFLSQFHNIEYLKINRLEINQDDNSIIFDNSIFPSYPHLKALNIGEVPKELKYKLIEHYSNQIESISLQSVYYPEYIRYNIKLPKLKELSIDGSNSKVFCKIIKDTKLLKMVSIFDSKYDEINQYKNMMNNLFKTQNNLEFVEVLCEFKRFKGIINLIQKALIRLRNEIEARNVLKISFYVFVDDKKINLEKVILSINKLIDALNNLNICSFIFICTFAMRKKNEIIFQKMPDKLKIFDSKYLVKHCIIKSEHDPFETEPNFQFTISTRNCQNYIFGPTLINSH